MDVILLERISRLGGVGDIVKVRDGFARNFLLPQKKAMRATAESKKLFEERRHIIEAQNAEIKTAAEAKAKTMEGIKLVIQRQASEEGKLYGSVAVRDVADALQQLGFDVPRSQILLPGGIKSTGTYIVTIALHADVLLKPELLVKRTEIEGADAA